MLSIGKTQAECLVRYPGWGARLGYSPAELARANACAIALLAELRDRYAASLTDIVLSGMVGPQDDGYQPGGAPSPGEAAAYHRPQIEAFATAGADMVSAFTLTSPGEAIGIVQAARAAGLPVTISFTVETDGRLPSGLPLAQAISEVDCHAGPDYFMVNCAHPTHIGLALAEPGPWRQRIRGLGYNASAKSHAELDEATGLDDGNPRLLAGQHARLARLLPPIPVLGGCRGTDTATSPPSGPSVTNPDLTPSEPADGLGALAFARTFSSSRAPPYRSTAG